MPNFGMAEQYGINCTNCTEEAMNTRSNKWCPFINEKCNKKGGICSITDNEDYTILCPRRFREDDLMFKTVCDIAFGSAQNCIALGEVAFLDPLNESPKSVGSIDNLLVQYNEGKIEDWCALEIQAAYFSGNSMGKEIKHFETEHELPTPGSRRPDIRSSATKRLLPQLEIKIPPLRRWGKKMFVAIDDYFFDWMPNFTETDHISNADICWTIFSLDTSSSPFKLKFKKNVFATLEDSRKGLIAGKPKTAPEYEEKILEKIEKGVLWDSN